MKRITFLLLISILPLIISAQHTADSSAVAQYKENTGLKSFLESGRFDIFARSFTMATFNRGDLLDYNAMAVGGGLGYYSADFKGFHFGLSGFFAFQAFEHNIRIADPTTNNGNRYEILLFDMSDIDNTNDFDRLEDLYIAYRRNGFDLVFGRHVVNTPLLNEQDNRMRHNSFSGFTGIYRKGNFKVFTGLYSHVTLRGTVRWYSVEDSFGVYPFGRNPLGTPSGYKGQISSRGIGVLGLSYKSNDDWYLQAWNYTADNVFNLSLLQLDGKIKGEKLDFIYGVQGLYQRALNHGGNENIEQTFMDANSRGEALGARLGVGNAKQKFTVNFLRIGENGRFLFPREWGREQLYVSLSRERHEGNGGVTAAVVKYERTLVKSGVHTALGAGYVKNPELDNFALNKYGIPSYWHFTGSATYAFHGALEGIEVMVLVAHKSASNPSAVPDEFRINRVDMWNLNTVVNFRF